MEDDVIAINGVNAASGDYLVPPLSPEDISRLAQGEALDPSLLADQKAKLWRETEQHFAPMQGIDANDLSQAGWGVVFAHNADPAVREALKELLDFRRDQAGRAKERFYREFGADKGYRAGDPKETKRTFLARNGAAAGQPPDPDKVPYYLLIVGDPATIPYRFQYQLDVEYAVGRVWFERGDRTPDLEAFAHYARSVVEVESGRVPLARRAFFVGVENADDRATRLSARELVMPLAEDLAREHAGWEFRTHLGDEAKKSRVVSLLGGAETPAFLFTASHGIGFPNGDPRQLPHQGGLLCQDWPGPMRGRGPIGSDLYLAGDDVGDDARLLGLLAFHFACYGAGTPALDDFPHLRNLNAAERDAIAPRPFVARLPQRLLGHPKGGALAVIGHIERAWGCSFFGGGKLGRQLQTFKGTLTRLLEGQRVGWALEWFNQYYAALSSDLSEELESIRFGKITDNLALSEMWTSNNDARSFVVVGDPAVRLTFPDGAGERPTIRPVDESSLVPRRSEPEGGGGEPESLVAGQPATRHDPSAESGPAPSGGAGESDEAILTIPLEVRVRVGVPGSAPRLVVRAMNGVRDPLPIDGLVASPITNDPQYGNREGYDPEFLGSGALRVSLPRLSAALRAQAARLADPEPGANPHELKYHHFSIFQHKSRRSAIVTAVNIDGRLARPIRREADRWIFDPRIDLGSQAGDEFYTHNEFDRGHLVRRLDPAWGRTEYFAKVANDDTFHFTNCTLQHARFNEGKNLWAGLEDYLLGRATGDRKRLTVFTGPVFADDDPEHRGVRVPRRNRSRGVAPGIGSVERLLDCMNGGPPLPPDLWDKTPPDVRAAILALVLVFERRIASLEARIHQNSSNSSRPPSTDGPRLKRAVPRPPSRRKRGGQKGHPKAERTILPPDEIIDHKPSRCSDCGTVLVGDDLNPIIDQVIELPAKLRQVIHHRRHTLDCPHCRARTAAPHAPEAARGFGPGLQAAAAYLSGFGRLGKRTIATIFADLFGIPMATGSVSKLEARTSTALHSIHTEALKHTQGQDANVDETGWREGLKRAWLWVSVTDPVTVFLIRGRRDRGAFDDLVGPKPGVLTTDRYSVYGHLNPSRRQVCWAHLRRDFQAMIDRRGEGTKIGEELLHYADILADQWRKVRDGIRSRSWFRRRALPWLREEVHGLLAAGSQCGCAKTSRVCRELLGIASSLWTFASRAGVEPTNNAAERAVRHAVCRRKTSYGTAGEQGSRFVERILSVLASCRSQRRSVLEFLTRAITAHQGQLQKPSLLPQGA